MEFKIIRNEESFMAERDSWSSLYQSNTLHGGVTPFQSWEWCYTWWKYREEKDSLFIIKAFTGKKVEGYAPLIIKNGMVEFIGGQDIDYGRFLINDNPVQTIIGFIETVKEYKLGFSLQEMCCRDTQLHIVERYMEAEKNYFSRRTTRTTFIEINGFQSFDLYLKTLSQSMRNKTIKVALKTGIIIGREKYSDFLKEEIKQIYESRQEARGGISDITWAFPIIEELDRCNLAEIYIARVDGRAVGFLISLTGKYGKNIWLVAFHMDYLSYYPGQMLFYQAIKDSFEEHCEIVDFMRGDYDFKMRWNVEIDANYTICVYPKRRQYIKNKIYFWIRPKIKKLVYKNKFLKKVYKKYA